MAEGDVRHVFWIRGKYPCRTGRAYEVLQKTVKLKAADQRAFAHLLLEANLNDGHKRFWFDGKFLNVYSELNHGVSFVTQTHLKLAFDFLSEIDISEEIISRAVREYRGSISDLHTRELDV